MVLTTCIFAQMKVYFSLLYAEWHRNAPKCYWMLIKMQNRYWISDLCADVRFLALLNVSLRYWSSFHENDCVFSHNEQQKVYKRNIEISSWFTRLRAHTLVWVLLQDIFDLICFASCTEQVNLVNKLYSLAYKVQQTFYHKGCFKPDHVILLTLSTYAVSFL